MCIAMSVMRSGGDGSHNGFETLDDFRKQLEIIVVECAFFKSAEQSALMSYDVFVRNHSTTEAYLLLTQMGTPTLALFASGDHLSPTDSKDIDERVRLPADLPGQERWSGLMTIGVAMLTSAREGKETSETRYFISSLPMGVKLFAHAVRSHWAIENSCHWSLDFIYREDESRIRDKHLRENFAWLNRFTLSLLKQHPAKISQVMKRRRCGWNENFLLEVLVGITS